jgi:hypothetical protein
MVLGFSQRAWERYSTDECIENERNFKAGQVLILVKEKPKVESNKICKIKRQKYVLAHV